MTRYIYDTFTDTDAVLLPNHTPDIDVVGGGWTSIAGVWDILSNEAKTSSDPGAKAVIDSGIYDGRFKVDLMVGLATGIAYLQFRQKDVDECWHAGLDDNAQTVILEELTPGGLVRRATVSFAQDEATWYEIKVLCQGDFIQVFVDDVLYITHASESLQTETGVGIVALSNPDARFDNFIAEDRPTCCYCTTTDIKNTFGTQWTEGVAFDTYLETLIFMASRLIDREQNWRDCHYAISDSAATNRHYDTRSVLEMQIDRCLDDAAFAVAVDEQSNGTYVAWVRNTDYIAYPLDEGWITKIVIKDDASKVFTSGQRLLRVTGRWGAFATPPHEIQQACIITTSRWFKRGLQQFQDTGALLELGELTYTKALDPDVIEILRVSARRIALG